jgi:hypothetical protein
MTPAEKRWKEKWSADRRKRNEVEDAALLQFFPTPSHAVELLLKKIQFEGLILEPACGKGNISKVLLASGYHVRSSDLGNHGYGEEEIDFFTLSEAVPNIVTNPPFGDTPKWIRRCLKLAEKKVALLLPIEMLGGKARYEIFRTRPPRLVFVLLDRISFKNDRKKYHQTCAWFVWEEGFKDRPQIEWLE